ncbi:hypothetical protein FI667_g7312, partial [Globisporangium splendens]
MRPGQFYDPAEKSPARSDPTAYAVVSASAPPLSDDVLHAPQQPQRHQQQYPREDQLPPSDYYDHGAFRQQHSQSQVGPPHQSFQRYPPGHHPAPPPPPPQQFRQQPPQYANQYPDAQTNEYPRQTQYTVSLNPSMRRKLRKRNKHPFVKDMLRLVAFHFLNALLGLAAFPLLLGGVSSSASLIPLCCFGIVVFRIVLYGVQILAHLDVLLYNFISAPSDQVYLEKPGQSGVTGIVMAPSLAAFSPMSLTALLYFLSVKFGVALLSAMSVSFAVGGLVVFVASVFSRGDDMMLQVGSTRFSYHADPFAFMVAVVCFTVIGVALMQVVAKMSNKATKFFCCEPFSTYQPFAPAGYQPQYQQQQQQPYAYVTVSYGST